MLSVFLKYFSLIIIIKYYANLSMFQSGLNSAAAWGVVFSFALVEKAANVCPKQPRKRLFGAFPEKANIHFVCTTTALT